MKTGLVKAALASLVLFASANAQAAMVTLNFQFEASDFQPLFGGPPAPVDPVSGNVSFTFDNSADFAATTTGLTIHSLTLPLPVGSYAPQFSYLQSADLISFATHGGPGSCWASSLENNMCMFIQYASGSGVPSSYFFQYTDAALTEIFNSYTIRFSSTLTAAVPEPASWALMIGGFALAGGALRRRHGAGRVAMRGAALT